MTETIQSSAASFDTGPLSWVIGEIRDALARSQQALHDAAGASMDAKATCLQHAKAHLHQAHGALQMVDVDGAGLMTQVAEDAIERFKDGSLECDAAQTAVVTQAFQAVVEYLEELLSGAVPQPARLFPYYRAVLEMLGASRIHPADLFFADLSGTVLPAQATLGAMPDYAACRAQFEKALLPFLKSATKPEQQQGAQALLAAITQVAEAQVDATARTFWFAMQTFAEMVAGGAIDADKYVKQLFGLINLQIRRLSQGQDSQPGSMLRDAMFFIAAASQPNEAANTLRKAYRLGGMVPPDYEKKRYGRIDAQALTLARDALSRAKSGWSALAAGDVQGSEFADALGQLQDASGKLDAPALQQLLMELGRAAHDLSHAAGGGEFALEMARALLFVEHGLDHIRRLPDDFDERAEVVGARMLALGAGETPPEAPQWQGDLSRQSEQARTVGVLATEMKAGLRQVEKVLDDYYFDAAKHAALAGIDPILHQLEGALSILDQDHALRAATHVRNAVRTLAGEAPDPLAHAGALRNIAQNVGALGFFIDMLAQNFDAARERFSFDEQEDMLRAVPFGQPAQHSTAPDAAAPELDLVADEPAPALVPAMPADDPFAMDFDAPLAPIAEPAPEQAMASDALSLDALAFDSLDIEAQNDDTDADAAVEAELLEIFIEEAREVLAFVGTTLPAAHADPANQDTLTLLRRSFHTLKGSGRMVGLDRFADAGAALERVMNVWLSEARSATPDLLALLDSASAEMRDWVGELVANGRSARTGEAIIEAAGRVQEGQAFAAGEVESKADGSNVLSLDLPAFDAPVGDASAMDLPALDLPALDLPAPDAADIGSLDFDDLDLAPEQHPELAPVGNVIEFPAPVDAAPAIDDNIKRIGDIEIPLPLHAIYLAETDEIVRLLSQDFSEWHHEPQRAVSPAALKASHTLTGTSATVGFKALRELAYALEMALKTLVAPAPILNDGQRALIEATLEQVRLMLQEFAVGVPSAPQPDLVEQLQLLREQLTQTDAVANPESGLEIDKSLEIDEGLDERLDILFGATLAAIALDPPVQPAAEAEADDGPHPVSAADDIDNMFDVAFDDPFEEPALTQAVPPMDHLDIASLPSLELDDEPEPEPEPELEIMMELAPAPEPEPEPEPEIMMELAPAPEPEPEPEPEIMMELAPAPEPEPEPAPVPEPAVEAWTPAVAPQAVATQQLAPVEIVAGAPAYADDLDPDLLPVFLEEANDLLPEIGNAVRAWQNNPSDTAPAQSLLRALHTVKGSARMAGAMRLGQHVHEIESQVENMVHAGTSSSTAFDELVSNYDIALQLHDQLLNPGSAQAIAAAPGQPASAAAPAAVLTASPVSAQAEAQARVPLVRVRADVLDRLVNQAGEVSITRSKLENQVESIKSALGDFSENLGRLRNQLREVEMQAETQIASRTSTSTDRGFDPLEFDRFTRLQELTRMMAESVNDVASFHDSLSRTVDGANEDLAMQSRLTRDLQQDLMRVRMVPFSSVSERLFRVARQCAKEVDKRVNLDIRGGSVEVDRSVLEQMVAPFEHLLRNAIVHGIESRAARSAGGKSETGELLIQASGQGNEVVIQFHDDGAGLDLKRIRAKAEKAGLLQPGIDVSDAQAAELIFEPGFSTAETLTELAGRGVGMDVVRSEAQALGGRVEIQTEPGKGARFSIHLPLTLAVTQVVLIESAGKTYAVPSILVEQVLQLKEQVVRDAHLAGTLAHQGQPLPLAYLAGLLGDRAAHPLSQRSVPVLVLRSGADRLAIHVDAVIGNREVVIKNVGPQLARMAGIAGATVLGSGDIVLILNPVALMHHAVQNPVQHKAEQMDAALATQTRDLVVMVVDDSLTVRKVTQRLLEREGYRVMLAKDGVDALEQLQQTVPDLMLVDIEMPRMDGFDLTRNIRAHEGTRAIPIIMITSRTADKHRNLALDLGVNAYFGKPFQEEALQAEIASLLKKEAVA